MNRHSHTEDQLVEQPEIGMFTEYSAGPNPRPRPFSHWEKGGWQAGLWVRCLVLVSRLRAALERLNPALPPEAITVGGLIEWLTADCRKSHISSRFLFE
jgi:type I restriction enzyme, R subunit